MNSTKTARGVVVIIIALACVGVYGIKHFAHKQCVRGALEMRCKHLSDCRGVVDVEVPWWSPFSDGYSCSAKVNVAGADGQDKTIDVTFTAKRVGAVGAFADVVKAANGKDVADDWEVNMGFWGWVGDDYRIQELKAK